MSLLVIYEEKNIVLGKGDENGWYERARFDSLRMAFDHMREVKREPLTCNARLRCFEGEVEFMVVLAGTTRTGVWHTAAFYEHHRKEELRHDEACRTPLESSARIL